MELDDCIAAVRAEVVELLAIGGLDGGADETNLFELGFDSLCAIELMARLRDNHAVAVSVDTLFRNPTIKALAILVHESSRARR